MVSTVQFPCALEINSHFVINWNGVRALMPVSYMSIDQSHLDYRELEGFNKSPKGSNMHRLRGQICVADQATVPLLPFSLNWVNHQKRTGPPQSPWFMTPHYDPQLSLWFSTGFSHQAYCQTMHKIHQWIPPTVRAHRYVGFKQKFSLADRKYTKYCKRTD